MLVSSREANCHGLACDASLPSVGLVAHKDRSRHSTQIDVQLEVNKRGLNALTTDNTLLQLREGNEIGKIKRGRFLRCGQSLVKSATEFALFTSQVPIVPPTPLVPNWNAQQGKPNHGKVGLA